MQLPDGSVLMHGGAPYDPAKAHEYYLKTRHLHPRKKGYGTYTVNEGGHAVKLSADQLAEEKAYAAHRVAQSKAKLAALNKVLKVRLDAAHKKPAHPKPLTAAEKAKAARDAKQYRAKHKQTLANKAKKSGGAATKAATPKKHLTTAALKKEIVVAKQSLKTAVAKQRELATAKLNG